MTQFLWLDVKTMHPGAYRAEALVRQECRVEVVWTQTPGIKKPDRITARLTYKGGSLWRVQKDFVHFSRAFNFFESAKGQAEIRLKKLNCAD